MRARWLGSHVVITALLTALSPVVATPVRAQAPVEIPRPVDLAQALEDAKQTYFRGGHREALAILEELQLRMLMDDEAVDREVAIGVLTYLGEIRYLMGEYELARLAFVELLKIDPEVSLSTLEHPTAIVGHLEQLRRELEATTETTVEVPPPPPEFRRLPWWGYAPLGIPQLGQQQLTRGMIYATLQTGFAIGSIGLLSHLQFFNGTLLAPRQWPAEDFSDAYQQVQTQRFALQWPLTAAFYLTWVVSHIDARQTWNSRVTATLTLGSRNSREPRMLWVRATF